MENVKGKDDNIKVDLGDIGCEDVGWFHLAQYGPVAGP
jgi:hypothetical protein